MKLTLLLIATLDDDVTIKKYVFNSKLHQEILNEYNPTVHKMRFDLLCRNYVEEVAQEFHQQFVQTIIITEAQSLLLFSKLSQYITPEKIN